MVHWQRHEETPPEATFIEHIEVVVEAESGDAACRASKALLGPEWTVRCVMVEPKRCIEPVLVHVNAETGVETWAYCGICPECRRGA